MSMKGVRTRRGTVCSWVDQYGRRVGGKGSLGKGGGVCKQSLEAE